MGEDANGYGDPYFGTPTAYPRGTQAGGPGTIGPVGPVLRRARTVAERAGLVGTAALGVLADKGLVRRRATGFSEEEARTVSDWLGAFLTLPEEHLDEAASPAELNLADAVRGFRELVPLATKETIDGLTRPPVDLRAVLQGAREGYELGFRSSEEFERALDELGKRAGLVPPAPSDLDATADFLAEHLPEPEGAPWVLEGAGAEARAYLDEDGAIYKLSPIRFDVLAVETVGAGPLTLRADQPPLFDAEGSMPWFERLVAANGMKGYVTTELVAIVDDGRLVIKQPYLGRVEPPANLLVEEAAANGHVVLALQAEDPRFGGDVNVCPLLVSGEDGLWLALDYNSRNSRLLGERAVPFDLVFRKLDSADFTANADLRTAEEKLRRA